MSKRIDHIVDELVDQYLFADDTLRPWIIGFSGGKDSTVLLQLVWKALQKAKKIAGTFQRDVYVVSNDTLVENPIITEYVHKVLAQIERAALDQDLPIKTRKTIPRLEDSFWVNLIGRGYPVPNSSFRWCTERLKVRPTSRFLLEQLDINGEAIILLGTRSAEARPGLNRLKSMQFGASDYPNTPITKEHIHMPLSSILCWRKCGTLSTQCLHLGAPTILSCSKYIQMPVQMTMNVQQWSRAKGTLPAAKPLWMLGMYCGKRG